MSHETREEAEEELRKAGWRRLNDGVYGKGRKRAYVASYCDRVEIAKTGRPPMEKTKSGWIISYWPIPKAEGRKLRDELGGKAWM